MLQNKALENSYVFVFGAKTFGEKKLASSLMLGSPSSVSPEGRLRLDAFTDFIGSADFINFIDFVDFIDFIDFVNFINFINGMFPGNLKPANSSILLFQLQVKEISQGSNVCFNERHQILGLMFSCFIRSV